jgi:hypothetical protein
MKALPVEKTNQLTERARMPCHCPILLLGVFGFEITIMPY